MGLVDKIKKDVQRSGQSKSKFTYIRDGQKVRVRFLVDMDEGMEIVFHDSYEKSINVPCRETFGDNCPYCEDESLRTRSNYIWPVWNYETKQVELFIFKVNNCSPLPALIAMYDNYGTITDRDYVISCTGKQTNKTFTVIPMDKVKFRNTKAKPFSKSAVLKMVDKAFPDDNDDVDDDDEEVLRHSKKNQVDDDGDWDDEQEDNDTDYSEMKPVELFKLCEEHGIEAKKKKPSAYYITLLEEFDAANDDWGDEDGSDDDEDEDDWDDED